MTSGATTVDGDRPARGIDRTAPRPPFRFDVDVPEPWMVIDLDPRTSARWVRQLLRRRAFGGRRTAVDSLAAGGVLCEVIRSLRAQGVLLAAILAASTGHEAVGASVTVGWQRTTGVPDLDALGWSLAWASLGGDELRQHRRVDLVALPCGRAVRLLGRERACVPGTSSQREVALHQLFVPVAASSWLAVVTATTAVSQLFDAVGDTALHVAGSIRAGDAVG